jgi:hypothetical protein
MNSWTISRRIGAGFVAMVVISAALGLLGMSRLGGVSRALALITYDVLPSVLTLDECASLARDNLFSCLRYADAETAEARNALEDHVASNRSRMDELFRKYDPQMIVDDEDRRLFDEIRRTRETFVKVRGDYLELVRQGRTEEHKKMLTGGVIPAYEASVRAVDASVQHKKTYGFAVSEESKAAALSSILLLRIAVVLTLVAAVVLAWLIARSTTRALGNLATNLDLAATQTAAAARHCGLITPEPGFCEGVAGALDMTVGHCAARAALPASGVDGPARRGAWFARDGSPRRRPLRGAGREGHGALSAQ